MGRIGLFGGTFDPPHVGHLILASVMADALSLDSVWFLPAADPPHKQAQYLTPLAHRLAMVQAAIKDDVRFELSLIDAERPGPHYSADMVRIVQEMHPEAALYFLMGGDSCRDFPQWKRADDLLSRCKLAVLRRPDAPFDKAVLAAQFPQYEQQIIIVDGPSMVISSSAIAETIQANRSIRYLVPPDVLHYINSHQLYTLP